MFVNNYSGVGFCFSFISFKQKTRSLTAKELGLECLGKLRAVVLNNPVEMSKVNSVLLRQKAIVVGRLQLTDKGFERYKQLIRGTVASLT